MKKSIIIVLFFLFIQHNYLIAQHKSDDENGRPSLIGVIFDRTSNSPVEYANIVIRSLSDSLIITGSLSDKDGRFKIPRLSEGKYIVDIRFLGFKRNVSNIEMANEKSSIDLGNVYIEPDPLQLKEVVVQGDRSPVSYQIDKKVIDVSKMQTVVSGTAADVLQNVPSVTVDIEGNVSLRGSTNFTVLIDGRPTVMNAQDALQQIPATSLEKIEIITNPSAKYDPEGTSGIINILMKKNQNHGLSGVINANAGLKNKYGGDFLFQYKTESYTAILGADYNKRNFPGTTNSENRFIGTNTSYLNSNGSSQSQRKGSGVRGSIEFNLTENAFLNLGGRFGKRDGLQNSLLNYSEWTSVNPLQQLYTSSGSFNRGGTNAEANLSYTQRFNKEGHEIKGDFTFGYDDDKESSITNKIISGVSVDGDRIDNSGPSREFEGKADYTLPFSTDSKFEAGYEGQAELSEENNNIFQFNDITKNFDPQQQFNYSVKYRNSDHSLYSIYSDKFYDIGIQGGLRTEYTFRSIILDNNNKRFAFDRWDFFPTLHTSYKIGEVTQTMASYTRRIQRPHGWELEPYVIWTDANNVRVGNPDLKPQYIDSYEAGVQTLIGEVSVSADVYYRTVNNKIERVRSVYLPNDTSIQNVTLTSMSNIGHDYSLGSEYMLIFDPVKFWNVNLMANIYSYKVVGVLPDGPFTRTSFNWGTRFNNVFKINGTTQLQLNLNYNSPTVSSQGRVEQFFTVDVSAKHDFFNRLLSATLQVRDLFGTAKMENRSQGSDFYSYSYMKRESPVVMLNLRLNFNNFERDRQRRDENDNQNDSNGDITE
ncbi:MAG: TonB-dependent receptor [Ignavibacteriales bacterium]|nr:TonB-dependent receptor [Ignavibacteriales bacterium]